MGKKPTTHIVDADREIPANFFASGAKFSLCGVFFYKSSEQVDNADPSCQKCLRSANSRRRSERPSTKNRSLVTKAR